MTVKVPPLAAPGTSGAGPIESFGSVAIDAGRPAVGVDAVVSVACVLAAGAQRRDQCEHATSGGDRSLARILTPCRSSHEENLRDAVAVIDGNFADTALDLAPTRQPSRTRGSMTA